MKLLVLIVVVFISNLVNSVELNDEGFTKDEYSIIIPEGYLLHLYEMPEKPEILPANKLEISLKKGDKIKANIVTKLSDIADDCKDNKKAYKWIYTKDWLCVKVTSSIIPENINKTGWINKMFVNFE